MSEGTVAIVGSGIAGTTIAYLLTRKGYDVDIFEKGPYYPYPHLPQFRDRILHLYENPAYRLPNDLQNLTLSGNYPADPDGERYLGVGGSATHWDAIALRIPPQDFKTRSRYGYGDDWPVSYDDLEPYYCDAEHLLGVSGTDTDNPFAPRRSRPYPLPPFALSYDDRILAERLHGHGIVLHTTPQARTRLPYDKRPGCQNFGTCQVCPIGVRYSPTHHLMRAVETGRCRVHINTSVRRLVLDRAGRARALVYQHNDGTTEQEHGAKVIIVAAGAIESARLLLLSSIERHPDGLTHGGHVGQHLTFHHDWWARLHYQDHFLPESIGAQTGQSHQFLDPPGRGRHGGIKVEFISKYGIFQTLSVEGRTGPEITDELKEMRHWCVLNLHAESLQSPKKFVALSSTRDRWGDPFAHVHYESSAFDHETHRFAQQIFDKFVAATHADHAELGGVDDGYFSAYHHMGTCRMGVDAGDSVVDRVGRVHGISNLFVIGSSNFTSPGTVNPTLTIVALAIRAGEYVADHVL
jgi:choline dehydrogenase-like flavoprotein